MFFNSDWENCYEELISWYPVFYREVRELKAILQAHGGLADGMQAAIEQVVNNAFVETADVAVIERLESFLGIGLNKSKDIEERRRLMKSYMAGFGKVSASLLAEMISSYTGAEVEAEFTIGDDEGNSWLFINFLRGSEATLYMNDILTLLTKKIPAHIKWQATPTYRYSVGVGRQRKHYKYTYDLCGTKPETVLIAQIEGAEAVTLPGRTYAVMDYKQSSDSGANPEAGTYPQVTTLAHNDVIDAATEAVTTDCGVNYIPCGTNYAGKGG